MMMRQDTEIKKNKVKSIYHSFKLLENLQKIIFKNVKSVI